MVTAPVTDIPLQSAVITGIGLITGRPCSAELHPNAAQTGILFKTADQAFIPARLSAVQASDRGVTLVSGTGQTLSIVEHFLAACALAHVSQICVCVDGPELPILDGSAAPWLPHLQAFKTTVANGRYRLNTSIKVMHPSNGSWVSAEPAEHFQINYTVDFPHPALQNQAVSWSPTEPDAYRIAQAGTFGLVSELPAMQARGLALGVTPDNTLGLESNGGYTRPLRLDHEPAYHKVLDCLGDLMLTGINPLHCDMRITAHKAGHGLHIQLAEQLVSALEMIG